MRRKAFFGVMSTIQPVRHSGHCAEGVRMMAPFPLRNGTIPKVGSRKPRCDEWAREVTQELGGAVPLGSWI